MANNVLATKGLERIAAIIGDDISHNAIGTGTTTPTAADIKLVTETQRNSITLDLEAGKSVQSRTFFTNAELPATMEEVGWFMNGTATVDSGELLTRALINFVKADGDLLIIQNLEFEEKT